jgi:leader peptidase (prepilin peptidase)/N-methyltransferase
MRVDEVPLWFARAAVIVFGLLWGSFLNVVIWRVPRGESVVHPGSRCPGCGTPIAAWDNVPLVSFLVLRGRARCCGVPMSWRYPAVELLGGATSLAVFEVLVRARPEDTVGHAAFVYLVHFALCLALTASAFIDLDHMYLPDPVTIGGTIVGLVTAPWRGVGFRASAIGAVSGYLVVWLLFVVAYRAVRGRPGMGLGDAKLLALAGAWFGWVGAAFVLFAGAFQATIAVIVVYLVRGKIEEPAAVKEEREELARAAAEGDEEAKELLAEDPLGEAPPEGLAQMPIPFGPFLILALFEWLFAGDVILGWVLPPGLS